MEAFSPAVILPFAVGYLVVLQRLERVLDALLVVVRREDVDDAQVVDLVQRPVVLVRRAESAIVLRKHRDGLPSESRSLSAPTLMC